MSDENADVARRTFEAMVTRHRGYRTRDEALEAAGLRD
jgi:hypothetical protein